LVAITTLLVALLIAGQGLAQDGPTAEQQLGELLYFDENLSTPPGQSCASCHDPDVGFDDPEENLPVSQGVLPKNRFGNRNSPISAYAMYAPTRYFDGGEGLWIGGQFWDSRATGKVLGDPLADQALGPFLNPLEMNNRNKQTVIEAIRIADYGGWFEETCGVSLKNVEDSYDCVALFIAAFERTELFGQFSSKYDQYLQVCLEEEVDRDDCAKGTNDAAAIAEAFFSESEWAGMQLFMDDEDGGAKCVACHVVEWTPDPGNVWVPQWATDLADGRVPPLFTDFTYDNLGVPKNPDNPFYYLPRAFNPDGTDFMDLGLGPQVPDLSGEDENGKFKVMTLRNIGVSAPYAHNGFFTTLKDITHFYNTRDDVTEGWPPPEYGNTVNVDELGNLGLTPEQEDLLVEFMLTLTDQ
jgi:cytochrome c peroxidase